MSAVSTSSSVPPGGVVTPEAVLLEFTNAGLATRILAKVLDVGLMAVLFGLLAMSLTAVLVAGEVVTMIFWAVSIFFIVLVLPTLVETLWNGKSPGKAALGLRVVNQHGGPISFRHAAIRNLLQLVELPTGIGVCVALGNRKSQRLGDLAAGTFVINERLDSSTVVPVQFVAPWGYEQYVSQLDVGGVTSEQFLFLRNVLVRVNQLSPQARAQLTYKTAVALSDRVRPGWDARIHSELYLLCVAAACQQTRGVFVTNSQL